MVRCGSKADLGGSPSPPTPAAVSNEPKLRHQTQEPSELALRGQRWVDAGLAKRAGKMPKRRRWLSPYLYRARNLIERFFNKIKQCRRIATRYDKLAVNYLAFIKLASIRIWLRANESTP